LVITIVKERFSETFANHPWPFIAMLIVRSVAKLPIDGYMFFSFFSNLKFMVAKKKEIYAQTYLAAGIDSNETLSLPFGT